MPVDFRLRLIWSADVENQVDLDCFLRQFPGLRIVKLDRLFVERFGPAAVERLRAEGYFVFDDAKIIDMPDKVEALARRHLKACPWMLSCMAGAISGADPDGGGTDALKRFADACLAVGTKPCGVTVLTSKYPETVAREFAGRTAAEQTLAYAEILLEAGFTDLLCSPAELQVIRSEARFDEMMLNVSGIRSGGTSPDDHARVATPVGAVIAGADRLIVGRPLMRGDPARAYAALLSEVSPFITTIEIERHRALWRQRHSEPRPPGSGAGNEYL